MNRRHLTPEERRTIQRIAGDRLDGLQEIVHTVASLISHQGADFAASHDLSTELRKLARKMSDLEINPPSDG